MPKTPPVAVDVEILRSILALGSIIAFLLLLNNGLFICYMIMSSSMGEMLDLSRSMNATTGRTMTKAHELMSGLEPDDIAVIVGHVRSITSDVDLMIGPVAAHSNMSALVSGIRKVAGAIDIRAVAAIVADAASIMHTANQGVSELHPAILARRIVELVRIIDPAQVRTVLDDILNVTAETRKIVDGLATTHNVQLKF